MLSLAPIPVRSKSIDTIKSVVPQIDAKTARRDGSLAARTIGRNRSVSYSRNTSSTRPLSIRPLSTRPPRQAHSAAPGLCSGLQAAEEPGDVALRDRAMHAEAAPVEAPRIPRRHMGLQS